MEVEFSLALNNRTGKYFAIKDMLDAQSGHVRGVRYWRVRTRRTPSGLIARVLGRLMMWEITARRRWSIVDRVIPRMRPRSSVLFSDALQVFLYDLRATDVVVVHDVGPLSHPAFYASGVEGLYREIYSRIRKAGPNLVFVSEAAKAAFQQRVGGDYSSTAVIYNPVRTEASVGGARPPIGVTPPFFLCVGAVGWRKNQQGALRGFAKARLADRGYQLVICGGPEPGYADVAAEAETVSGAVLLGYAKADELRWLYGAASGFVLPSRLEGFGMPAAEAIQRGLLPILSHDPALVEVAGDAAVLVDGEDADAIAAGLTRLETMSVTERAERLAKGRAGLGRFTPAVVQEAWSQLFVRLAAS